MKKKRRLRRYISVSLWGVALVMIAAYTVLVVYSVWGGIKEAASYGLHLKARDFENAYRNNPGTPLPAEPRLQAYIGEEDLPAWFKDHYTPATLAHAEMMYDEIEGPGYGQQQLLFFIAFPYDLHDGKRLYLIETFTEADDIPGAYSYSDSALILILVFGIGFILLILLVAHFLFCKVSGSVEILTGWANGLNRERIEQPRPDFKFHEINELADLIQNAVSNLQQAMTREHQFLRNASHELRTPIAVLRSNMDLLERLRKDPGGQEKDVYQRIRRAVDDMHQLTRTLLWLSRKEENLPDPKTADIRELVEDLVRDNRYLLVGKDVHLSQEMASVKQRIPMAALRICIGNLIRNAFQYTGQGTIEIRLSDSNFTITNRNQAVEVTEKGEDDYGFGLGLMLVEQITRKLHLPYENLAIPGGHRAVLSFSKKS